MRRDIRPEEAEKICGITTPHQEMDNGQLRFRLKKKGGSAYIRTESGAKGAWQKSHHHDCQEIYMVEREWIAFAKIAVQGKEIRTYKAGQIFIVQPDVHHNIYMPANAIIHTIKYGTVGKDWIADEDFDKLTDGLSEEQIKLESEKSKWTT